MKILITGSTGFLGPYLKAEFSKVDKAVVFGVSRHEVYPGACDLTQKNEVYNLVRDLNPDLIIHAAAMTNVDECQLKPEEAWAANVTATKLLVRYMPLRSRLVYISSDMVYSHNGPHGVAHDSVNPINVYGMTKLMGEFEAQKFPNHLILRTNMYGLAKNNAKKSSLVDFLLGAFKAQKPINLFMDSLFSPLDVETLCEYIRRLSMDDKLQGSVINLGASNGMSKSAFAMRLASNLGFEIPFAKPDTMFIPGRTLRPRDTRMLVGQYMPTMEEGIKRLCDTIRAKDPLWDASLPLTPEDRLRSATS